MDDDDDDNSIAIIIIVVLLVLFLLAVIVVIVWYIRGRKYRGKYSPADHERFYKRPIVPLQDILADDTKHILI